MYGIFQLAWVLIITARFYISTNKTTLELFNLQLTSLKKNSLGAI